MNSEISLKVSSSLSAKIECRISPDPFGQAGASKGDGRENDDASHAVIYPSRNKRYYRPDTLLPDFLNRGRQSLDQFWGSLHRHSRTMDHDYESRIGQNL